MIFFLDLNECATQDNPCANGGTCFNGQLGYSCQCPSQFTGDTCNDGKYACKHF